LKAWKIFQITSALDKEATIIWKWAFSYNFLFIITSILNPHIIILMC